MAKMKVQTKFQGEFQEVDDLVILWNGDRFRISVNKNMLTISKYSSHAKGEIQIRPVVGNQIEIK